MPLRIDEKAGSQTCRIPIGVERPDGNDRGLDLADHPADGLKLNVRPGLARGTTCDGGHDDRRTQVDYVF
jgi:hypothetical protein